MTASGARIVTAQIHHETNTFCRLPTTMTSFRRHQCVIGDEIGTCFRDTNSETAGFIEAASEQGWTLVPTIFAIATPAGPVERACIEQLLRPLLDALAPGADGVLLSLHGALVLSDMHDGDGHILERVRDIIGPDIPIAVTLDLHANVSPRLTSLANTIVSYRTYPHTDMRARAKDAAELLAEMLAASQPYACLRCQPPQIEIDGGGRTDCGAMASIIAAADDHVRQRDTIRALAVFAGFPAADIPHCGPSAVMTVRKGADEAQALHAVARLLWRIRQPDLSRFLGPDQAAARAAALAACNNRVVIADNADNPGSGAYGDSTDLLAALLKANAPGTIIAPIVDPEVVSDLQSAALGRPASITLGGKTDPTRGGEGIHLRPIVQSRSDGRYVCKGRMFNGLERNLGPSVVVRCDNVEILVTSYRGQIFDLEALRANGLEPLDKSIIAVKSTLHYRADFEPIADHILETDCGGLSSPRRTRQIFTNLRHPIHPFDQPDPTMWPP